MSTGYKNFYKNKNVLVTGGAGFIGSHLAEILVDAGAKVSVADNFSSGSMSNLRDIKNKIKIFEIDLEYPSGPAGRTFKNQDIVFNLAAKVANIDYNRKNQSEMFESNMLLQMNPLRLALNANVKKFIQASTVCVYPIDAIVPTPESEGIRGGPEATNEGYGWAKRMGEILAGLYSQKNMSCIVSRFSNVYGERDNFDLEMAHVIPSFIVKCLKDKTIEAWGSGNQTRSFLYVKDAAEGIMRLAAGYAKPDPINIGGSEAVSMKDLLNFIIGELKTENKVFWNTSYPDGHSKRMADTTKIKSICGWEPETTLKEGIKKTIRWYRENFKK